MLALHEPPLTISLSVIVKPTPTVDNPVIVPAEDPVTVTVVLTVAVPQLLVT